MVNVSQIEPRESYDQPRVKRITDLLTEELGTNGVSINPSGRHISVSVDVTKVDVYFHDNMIYSYGQSTHSLAVRIGEVLERGDIGLFNVYKIE